MKDVLLFDGEQYYSEWGFGDFIADFDTIEEAMVYAEVDVDALEYRYQQIVLNGTIFLERWGRDKTWKVQSPMDLKINTLLNVQTANQSEDA